MSADLETADSQQESTPRGRLPFGRHGDHSSSRSSRLSRVNTFLLVLILAINAYLIGMPFVPALLFSIQKHGRIEQRLEQKIHAPAPTSTDASGEADQPNRLIIPAMLYDHVINEGKTMAALHTGPWRRPNTSTPALGGNTVIAGHRFTYTNPRGTFYYLDKVHVGDEIGVLWQNKMYRYRVTITEVVPPNDLAIEAPTTDAQLTLYTCTPLWLPKNRLVVIAQLESAS